jgi:hypothetical protein
MSRKTPAEGALPEDVTSVALLCAQMQCQGMIGDCVAARAEELGLVWKLQNGATLMRPTDFARLLEQFVERNADVRNTLRERRTIQAADNQFRRAQAEAQARFDKATGRVRK